MIRTVQVPLSDCEVLVLARRLLLICHRYVHHIHFALVLFRSVPWRALRVKQGREVTLSDWLNWPVEVVAHQLFSLGNSFDFVGLCRQGGQLGHRSVVVVHGARMLLAWVVLRAVFFDL